MRRALPATAAFRDDLALGDPTSRIAAGQRLASTLRPHFYSPPSLGGRRDVGGIRTPRARSPRSIIGPAASSSRSNRVHDIKHRPGADQFPLGSSGSRRDDRSGRSRRRLEAGSPHHRRRPVYRPPRDNASPCATSTPIRDRQQDHRYRGVEQATIASQAGQQRLGLRVADPRLNSTTQPPPRSAQRRRAAR